MLVKHVESTAGTKAVCVLSRIVIGSWQPPNIAGHRSPGLLNQVREDRLFSSGTSISGGVVEGVGELIMDGQAMTSVRR